jgi:hypothetical protein
MGKKRVKRGVLFPSEGAYTLLYHRMLSANITKINKKVIKS